MRRLVLGIFTVLLLILLIVELLPGHPPTTEHIFKKNEEDQELKWALSPLDYLPWTLVQDYRNVHKELVTHKHVMENTFVKLITGEKDADFELHSSIDSQSSKKNGRIYRFSFAPSFSGQKARLEISSCYTKTQNLNEKLTFPEEIEILLKTSCPAANLPPKDLHTYSYEIYLPKVYFNSNEQYILTQWHGTPDPTILRDENGCIAQISTKDFHGMCEQGKCEQGQIFNRDKKFIGLRYCQGGYPPLAFSLRNGYFEINARSDEKIFTEKGGCGFNSRICPSDPREHLNTLWRIPTKDFKFDEWVRFKWKIKWSEYNSAANHYENPGTRTTDAWIRVWMNDEKIVDWTGPCGRNDNNRTPFFKAGLYSPSGSITPERFYFRRYKHKHDSLAKHKIDIVRLDFTNLQANDTDADEINKNFVKRLRPYEFGNLSSTSKNKCILKA